MNGSSLQGLKKFDTDANGFFMTSKKDDLAAIKAVVKSPRRRTGPGWTGGKRGALRSSFVRGGLMTRRKLFGPFCSLKVISL